MQKSGASGKSKSEAAERNQLLDLTGVFLRLGATAFGGPAAHVAMMNEELVRKRRWLTEDEFLGLVGVTQMLPGPNSTELAIYIGYRRAGWKGLILAGTAFILPAVLMVLALAAVYRKWGSLPDLKGVMSGIQPVVLAIIIQALMLLGKKAVTDRTALAAALGTFAGVMMGIPELILLVMSAIGVMWFRHRKGKAALSVTPGVVSGAWAFKGMLGTAGKTFSPAGLFAVFLKIGSLLYGSGYVLVAFLESEFVRPGLLAPDELLDAVAVGQVTPGPVFTTATFVGYLLGGVSGAIAATIGIFLPAFGLVAFVHPFVDRLRHSAKAGSFLEGLSSASLGIMAHAAWTIAGQAIDGVFPVVLMMVSAVLLIRFRVSSTWLIIAGGAIGWAIHAFT
jgi:chromate transporter